LLSSVVSPTETPNKRELLAEEEAKQLPKLEKKEA
jgi:hypothetical protein